MGDRTGIEWTDATWNPVVGCTKVSQGCKNCYAKTLHDKRHKAALAGKAIHPQYLKPFEAVQLMPERLEAPMRWRKPRRVFVNSVSDLFHDDVPDEFLDEVFAVMAIADRHTFQILTKRPQRMRDYFADPDRWALIEGTAHRLWQAHSGEDPSMWLAIPGALPNVWLGVSVENQAAANERIPLLLDAPAAVRFLSCEPLLGPIDMRGYLAMRFAGATTGIDWVIAGGESGQHARAMHLPWARSLRDQCVDAGVPFFFKQAGTVLARELGAHGKGGDLEEIPEDLRVRQMPRSALADCEVNSNA